MSVMHKRHRLFHHFILLLTGMLTLFILFPLIWMVFASFKAPDEFMHSFDRFFPQSFTLLGYRIVIGSVPVIRWFTNSVIITIGETGLRVISSVMAAYILARFRFRFKKAFISLVIVSIIIPSQVMVVPQFLWIAELGLLNNFLGVILPMGIGGFAIIYLYQTFQNIPDDYLEAAQIDGASEWSIMWHMCVPMAKASLAALVIVSCVNAWNGLQWPLIIMQKEKMYPITVAINYFVSESSINWSSTLAVAVFTALPVTVLYLIFQKHFIESFLHIGIKG